jgi:hypothetical protein
MLVLREPEEQQHMYKCTQTYRVAELELHATRGDAKMRG